MKKNPYCLAFLSLLSIIILTGCASFTPPMKVNELPSGNDAYLYGQFKIDTPKAWLGMDGHQTIGLSFSCVDGANYTIRFGIQDPLQLIKVAPSTCSLSEIIFTDADGVIKNRNPTPNSTFRNMALSKGTAYYMGDYFAVAATSVTGNMIRTSWRIRDMRDNYVTTTAEMQRIYPALQSVPTQNQVFISNPPQQTNTQYQP